MLEKYLDVSTSWRVAEEWKNASTYWPHLVLVPTEAASVCQAFAWDLYSIVTHFQKSGSGASFRHEENAFACCSSQRLSADGAQRLDVDLLTTVIAGHVARGLDR